MIVDFIKNIFETGELTVAREITPFTDTDQEITGEILKHYFDLYKVEFPNPHTIQFHEQAGFWAASYLYRLSQALVLRELSEKEVIEMLPVYNTTTISTDEVLTVDLLFQSIPFSLGANLFIFSPPPPSLLSPPFYSKFFPAHFFPSSI